MEIVLNGEPRELADDATVRRLLDELGGAPDGAPVAVAVNLSVVPRSEHDRRQLKDGDRVDIVGAVGGG